jgi:hypothetical protein
MAGKGTLSRLNRPIKKPADKRRREKVQRKRLIGLGVSEQKVKSLNSKEVRLMLKEPVKVRAACAKQAAALKKA